MSRRLRTRRTVVDSVRLVLGYGSGFFSKWPAFTQYVGSFAYDSQKRAMFAYAEYDALKMTYMFV